MEAFIIEGKAPLNGVVTPSGNKNAAFPLISAALLTDQPVILHNLPNIGDVQTMLNIIEDLGAEVTRHDAHNVTLRAGTIRTTTPDPARFAKIRGALVLMGALLAREGEVNLQALGARFEYKGGFTLTASELRGQDVLLDEASVTATENAILVAVLAKGTTVIRNAASEPHVQDLCHMLNQMGAQIQGIGSNMLFIHGVESLSGVEFTLGSDYLEVGSFIGVTPRFPERTGWGVAPGRP
jgi:UDP-N-acetylglucosamine 1-carboxyvinyltransferase